jgi:hypothetical protein
MNSCSRARPALYGQAGTKTSILALAAAMLVLCAVVAGPAMAAGSVTITTMGSPYTQDFDTLSNVAGSTTNALLINGWYLTESGGGARDNEQYAVDTGGSTTGDMYSYGAAASTERALGELRSGTLIPLFGASFTNNSGSTITSLSVSYTGEEWRLGTAGRTDQINFEYSTNATDLTTGSWTAVPALSFVTPDTVTVGAKNGNAAGERTALSATIAGLSILNGATFWIRWTDVDATGAEDGLAVDDFSLTPFGATAVTLTSLSATRGGAGVRLRWHTGTEADLLGFHVYRSHGHSWRRITHSLIGARGSVSGASYQFLDRTAKRGVHYRYRLKGVDLDGETSWFGQVDLI